MPRRSEPEREKNLLQIAEWYFHRVPQLEMVARINASNKVPVTQQTVSKDLKEVHKRWREDSNQLLTERKAIELAKIDYLEQQYLDAWARSTEYDEIAKRHQGREYTVLIPRDDRNPMGADKYLKGVQWCVEQRIKIMGLDLLAKMELERGNEPDMTEFSLPAWAIAPSYGNVYRHIRAHDYTEFVFQGGRGSTKSSFASLAFIEQIINNPNQHGLAVRKVENTLRDSVHSQLKWAIDYLGVSDSFKVNVSPMQITYKPTGQTIYFRGVDDPLKIKSIKPPFGYIGVLWFEELDQFAGDDEVRNVTQSAIRGGDTALVLKSFNPPKTANNWVTKWLQVPKESRFVHESTYLDVPVEWLGQVFIDEADHLKEMNPGAYEHEYLGVSNGTGGIVFENLEFREITDKEIFGDDQGRGRFERILQGQDWGYFPDPAHFTSCHYNPATLTLYIFGEIRKWKTGNKEMYDLITEYPLYFPQWDIICDSAEPKSVADFRSYGARARGAIKGADSIRYSMKWLQSRAKIVIDPARCPYTAEEFQNYEHELDKDGNFISDYPDFDNHSIDAVRYATNGYWKRRGI
jgi:phage terminase large subunit